ncbi:MAG: hypothetical protein CML68_03175 [Rhodobacteraceae bacterium]|nr:hypothetical protein [Paracoccaceae bacterium]
MLNKIKKLYQKEDGAVTVDWVVLTAAVVALAGTAIASIQGASGSVGTGVETHLESIEID